MTIAPFNMDLLGSTFGWEGTTVERLQEMFADPTEPRGRLVPALASVWSLTDQPTTVLPQAEWVRMFRQVGYFDLKHMLTEALPPTLRLYRGATAEFARSMAWTRDVQLARHYGATLWASDVPASAVLATIPHGSNSDDVEYVVDLPESVAVWEADPADSGTGITLAFPASTGREAESAVRAFLSAVDLHDMRPSALGWTVRTLAGEARVTFHGAMPVLVAVAERYSPYMSRKAI